MKISSTLSELKAIVREIIEEEAATVPGRSVPPPLPPGAPGATPQPASASLPKKGALHKFRADTNMAADAANKAKEAMERADTKEALRWLAKAAAFATSARNLLGEK